MSIEARTITAPGYYTDRHGWTFEVFEILTEKEDTPVGFYWWSCFPGCLPDSDASGPYPTAQAAYDNAVEV